jgi:osomolarity two-component system sensor histidine kinase SLN1
VTRILLQDALKSFYRGNTSADNWTAAERDVNGALASGGFSSLVQTIVYSRNATGNTTGLLRATAFTTGIQLPETYANGSYAMLGDAGDLGYPTELYPNITYGSSSTPDPVDPAQNSINATAFQDFPLNATSALLLGKDSTRLSLLRTSGTDIFRTTSNQQLVCVGILNFTNSR